MAAANTLFASAEFIRYMRSRDNSFAQAIKSLIKFYGREWSPPKPAQDVNLLIDVAPQTAATDERFFNAQSLPRDELRKRIFSFIDSCFEGGASEVYYQAILERLKDELPDGSICDVGALRAHLSRASCKYYIGRTYLTKDCYAEVDPANEVREYLLRQGAPVKIEAICNALPHIYNKKIKSVLWKDTEFANNGNGEYFHADSLRLSNRELKGIEAAVASLFEPHKAKEAAFITIEEMHAAIQKNCPKAFERNAAFSAIGWKNALRHKCGWFNFVGYDIWFDASCITCYRLF